MLDVQLRVLLGKHDLLGALQRFLGLFGKSAHHGFSLISSSTTTAII
jgi:hypothetical protein